MDYVTRQFINLTKNLRKDLRAGLRVLNHGIEQATRAIRDKDKANQQNKGIQPPVPSQVSIVRSELYIPEAIETQRTAEANRNFILQTILTLGTWLAFAAAAVYAGIAARQLHAIHESNRIGRKTMMNSQRAFVFVATQHSGGKDAKTMKPAEMMTGIMENGGNTPALEVRNRINQNFPEYEELAPGFDYKDNEPTKDGAPFPNSKAAPGTQIIGPHSALEMSGLGIPDEPILEANKGKAHVYLWGWVSYKDIFGCTHRTEFCEQVVYMTKDRKTMNIEYCPEHNCADKTCTDYIPTNTEECGEQ